jgi:hypothetical protein
MEELSAAEDNWRPEADIAKKSFQSAGGNFLF